MVGVVEFQTAKVFPHSPLDRGATNALLGLGVVKAAVLLDEIVKLRSGIRNPSGFVKARTWGVHMRLRGRMSVAAHVGRGMRPGVEASRAGWGAAQQRG